MKTSEHINELTAALAKASSKFTKIERGRTATVYPKDSNKKPYSYDYADLDDVLSAIRGPLAENGVVISHDAKPTKKISGDGPGEREAWEVEVICRLEHSSGQWKESSPFTLPCEGTMPVAQQAGSANTYARRYTTQNMLGLSTEADDDGNAAGGNEADTGSRQQRAPKPPCPKCETNTHVYEDRQKGGFFCWKQKGGCGHNWLPEQEKSIDELKESGKLTTADKLPSKGKSDLTRPEKSAVFESWATFVLAITPESFDDDLASIRQSIKEGKIKPPHVESIIRASAKRAETAGQFDMIDKLLLPLKETIRADDEGWTKLAIEVDKEREVKLGDPVPA